MPLEDAIKMLQDGLASGDVVIAAVAGVVLLGLVVLKLMKKEIPFLDPLLELVMAATKKLRPSKPAELPKDGGLADVVLCGSPGWS